ncbi:serine/threonine-protein kinase RIO3 isoform X1 [Canis lupus baileyi]|uniref:serine/threonine-protein kinase RIO3 isoform X1 n=2 Tax=Canis lupus dingo TaxID=286419 RepID=UPI0020C43D50|nr:serine/threonine-protein kinase RIO3 isoform X1 [Canis lupus dingo]
MDLVGVASPEPRPAAAWGPSKCPWATPQNTISCSLADVMSEQLAKELQLKEEAAAFPEVTASEGPFITGENIDTSSDLMLAQMLQMEFDREYDAQLRREEKKFNGDSKVSISFENYRKVHPYEDSDSSEDEVDWQDTRDDPYIPAKPVPTPKKGFIGKGKDITTKHDEVVCGRKNTARMENFAPGFQVGDGIGMDLKLSNHVFNALKQHAYSEERRSARLHEKKEHSTAEKAVDPKTRLLMYKMVNSGMLETITGCISTGKESVVFHAYGGRFYLFMTDTLRERERGRDTGRGRSRLHAGSLMQDPILGLQDHALGRSMEDEKEDSKVIPTECAIKVFKTTLNEFKNRDKYIKDDFRFKDRFSKLNPRKIIRMWAEKEMHNLTRMQRAGIPCPTVVLLKKHILVMSFIGHDQVPAPKLKEVKLSSEEMKEAYYQTLHLMQQLYNECTLVHADLSEYNMLWHAGKVWLIDVSQSVEPTHPHGLEFLFRDCRNVSQFFQKGGVKEALGERELFNAVSGLNISADNEADFLAEIEALEKMNEDHVQKNGRKAASFLKDDGGPPVLYDE